MMMGMWLGSSFVGNLASGYIGALYENHTLNAEQFFLLLMVLGIATGLAIFAFNGMLKRAMAAGTEHHHEAHPG
jgi:POT family proton-dependent oligopeptide transporter